MVTIIESSCRSLAQSEHRCFTLRSTRARHCLNAYFNTCFTTWCWMRLPNLSFVRMQNTFCSKHIQHHCELDAHRRNRATFFLCYMLLKMSLHLCSTPHNLIRISASTSLFISEHIDWQKTVDMLSSILTSWRKINPNFHAIKSNYYLRTTQRKRIVWLMFFGLFHGNLTSDADSIDGGERRNVLARVCVCEQRLDWREKKKFMCEKHELALNYEIKNDECFWVFWGIRFDGAVGCRNA